MTSRAAGSPARLAELLAELGLSQAELAAASRLSQTTMRRALAGTQTSARSRARIIAAINRRRAELQQPELAASDVFPTG